MEVVPFDQSEETGGPWGGFFVLLPRPRIMLEPSVASVPETGGWYRPLVVVRGLNRELSKDSL